MLIDSFRDPREFGTGGSLAPPFRPTLDNYRIAWTELGFGRMTRNSAILAICSTTLAVAIASVAAYALAKMRILGVRVWLALFVLGIAIPPIVVIVPLFQLAVELDLVNAWIVAIAGEVGFLVPFNSYLLYSYMQDLPSEQFESAALDGASEIQQFWHIGLPLSQPALIASAVLSFVFVWNDLLVPLIFWTRTEMQTLMTGLATLGPGRTGLREIPLLMAGVVISVAPLLVLYVFSRKKLAQGLAEGGGR